MTTIKKSTLFVLCVAILSQLTFVSCKDEELTEEERQQKQEQENNEQFLLTSEFWQVVGQLSNAEVLPDDWQHATFEPGIGEASDKSSTTRIVPTNDASAAAESFEHLTGVDVSNLIAYEWTRDFGTLTYHRLNDGTGWAAVDVDIKQMPGLKRIIYCTPEQQGLNASVPGTPYYRFGDVIKKKNENEKWEYWVCVRPCFGPEKKGDMHWMCLGNLPDKNIKSYTYTKQNRTWYWPTSLTTNYEHIKNLSEMTCAILEPERWANHYESNQDENLFHDFSYANIKYHNRYFWQLVQDAWNTPVPSEGGKTIFELLFHRDMGQLLDGKQQLNFFYGSASGPGTFSWYMNLNLISVIVRTADSKGFQCRDLVKKTSNKSCEKKEFDIREYSEKGYSTKASDSSFIEPGAYVYPLRYATGKQLFGSQPGYYQSMGGSNNIEDVYVFNKHYHQAVGSDQTMTVFNNDNDQIFRNRSYFVQGDVIRDNQGILWFCAQTGKNTYNAPNAADYAYFISFDSRALGSSAGKLTFNNLPSKQLASQILLSIDCILHNSLGNKLVAKNDPIYIQLKNIQDYAGIDLLKIVGIRDTNGVFTNLQGPTPCNFYNALYRDGSDICILRCIGDFTAKEAATGNRDMSWRFYDSYTHGLNTENKKKMLLSDLTDPNIISAYNQDRWVKLDWAIYDLDVQGKQNLKSPGLRTKTVNANDLSIWLYANQTPRAFINGDAVSNMYNEPVMAFAVKRVPDYKGKYPDMHFEDGTEYTIVSALSAKVTDMFNDLYQAFTHYTYDYYLDKGIFLNDELGYTFGMDNER